MLYTHDGRIMYTDNELDEVYSYSVDKHDYWHCYN